MNIPLNRRGSDDLRFWKGSTKGVYSVKLGYFLEMKSFVPPPFQSTHPRQSWWKLIWRLNIPPKVRIFLWRASRDFIPTAANLALHHVPTSGKCPLFTSHFASTSHCLLFCKSVRGVWKCSKFWSILRNLKFASFVECGIVLSCKLSGEDLEEFGILAWALWSEFCKFLHSTNQRTPNFQVGWAISLLEAYRVARLGDVSTNQRNICRSDQFWIPPVEGQLRLDVDAGYDESKNKFSIGAIVRDFKGSVLGVKACLIRYPGSTKGAELSAIRFGMDFCLNLGLSHICIFSDSLEGVKAILNPTEDLGPEGVIALDISAVLVPPIFLSIMHMRRTANMAAHTLAHKVMSSNQNIELVNCITEGKK